MFNGSKLNKNNALSVGLVQTSLYTQENGVSLYQNSSTLTTLIRNAMIEGGLGQQNREIPLADIIQPGMSVLLKPNWVLHTNRGGYNMSCMITQLELVLAVLQEVVATKPSRIILGDAPIQDCDWNKIATAEFYANVKSIVKNCQFEIIDFRRTVLRQGNLIQDVERDAREISRYTLFDLGYDSLLEPITRPEGRFRVAKYDARLLAKTHCTGRHQYLICKEALEVDLILSLPKLKMHKKAGITGALKNLVGLNGNKDFLPHHRVGGTTWQGDCYLGFAPLKRLSELLLDLANQNIGTTHYQLWTQLASRTLHWHKRFGDGNIDGSWHGNDTVWRMVLDLNRILLYGCSDGYMADRPQRQVWSLTDAVICGEGEGPLAPEPYELGVITFSNSSPAADWVHAILMGIDPNKIPLLKQAFQPFRWPLVDNYESINVRYEGENLSLEELASEFSNQCKPPKGWAGYCELSI